MEPPHCGQGSSECHDTDSVDPHLGQELIRSGRVPSTYRFRHGAIHRMSMVRGL